MGPVSGVTFIYATRVGRSTLSYHGLSLNPLGGARGPSIDISDIDGGRSRTPGTTS
jgi:hypothetical protein